MDEKKVNCGIAVGASILQGMVLSYFAERVMEEAESSFHEYKLMAKDTSCLVSWWYKRMAMKHHKVWHEGWILTSKHRNMLKKMQNETISKKSEGGTECQCAECREDHKESEKAKVRKPSPRSKRTKVRE